MLGFTTVFLVLSCLAIKAQVCDTVIDGEKFNCTDKLGRKHGKWVEFEVKLAYCFDTSNQKFISKIESYKHGVPHGEWVYLTGPKYNSPPSKITTYHKGQKRNKKEYLYPNISLETRFKKQRIVQKYKSRRANALIRFEILDDYSRLIKGTGTLTVLQKYESRNSDLKEVHFTMRVEDQKIAIINAAGDPLYSQSLIDLVDFEILFQRILMNQIPGIQVLR